MKLNMNICNQDVVSNMNKLCNQDMAPMLTSIEVCLVQIFNGSVSVAYGS